MADKSKIAWTEATWNPVSGCSKVSEGCRNCYAERDWPRLSRLVPAYAGRNFEDVACHPDRLDQPLRWKRPRKIFVNSMSDLFHPDVPDEFIARVFALMSIASWHTFQILTKRPERMLSFMTRRALRNLDTGKIEESEEGSPGSYASCKLRDALFLYLVPGKRYKLNLPESAWALPEGVDRFVFPLHNVWLGVSVEDQKTADERIPLLLKTPAAVRWVSIEPMIGPVSFRWRYGNGFKTDPATGIQSRNHLDGLRRLDWIVVGGESGPQARPMEAEWVRKITYECEEARVPLFVKQLGAAYSDPVDGIAGASLKIPEEAVSLLKRRLKHRSGTDMKEWPEGLRIRESPGGKSPQTTDGQDLVKTKTGQ